MKSKEEIWRRGEENPETSLLFWGYVRKGHTSPSWVTKEEFSRRKLLEGRRKKAMWKDRYREMYLNDKDSILKRKKETWKKRVEDSPLLMMIYSIRSGARNRNIPISITAKDVAEQWKIQKGICYYTNLPMLEKRKSNSPYQVSLDRINSSEGYHKGNFVLCCQAINFAKSNYPIEVFIKFLSDIKTSIK